MPPSPRLPLTFVAEKFGTVDDTTHLTTWYEEDTTGKSPKFVSSTLQLLKLAHMREELFAKNLVRPYGVGVKTAFAPITASTAPPERAHYWRTADGSWTDLTKDKDGLFDPRVGAAYTRRTRASSATSARTAASRSRTRAPTPRQTPCLCASSLASSSSRCRAPRARPSPSSTCGLRRGSSSW